MVKICRLLSAFEGIPHQSIKVGETLVIGRNRECRIRDIKCSRSHCAVTFDGNSVCVVYNTTRRTDSLTNGQLLAGNGFKYKIVFIQQNDESIDRSINGSIDRQLDQRLDEKQLSTNEEVVTKHVTKDSKAISSATVWQSLDSGRVHICRFLGGGQTSRSIAAFDFDGTLITTKSGNKFSYDINDWKLIDKSLPKRISTLIENGFRFVIISNQLPISQGRYRLDDIQNKFVAALTAIGCPCLVMIAAFDDIYRKPRTGLWRLLSDEFNEVSIDLKNSFFVGDAAGRKKQLNGISDHSSADLLFAANSEIPFLTPEKFYSDVKPKTWDLTKTRYSGLEITTFRPKRSDDNFIAIQLNSNQKFKTISELLDRYSNQLHSIVFCGLPASGKSSFYNNYLQALGYSYVSRDVLKTMDKCLKKFEHNLQNKRNSVIDNINVDLSARKLWVDMCHKYSAVPLLFYFEVTVEQALHSNKYRRIIGGNSPVTDLVIRSQNKNFVKPLPNEGFEGIYKINFMPKFDKTENQFIYYMFLSER